MNRTRYRLVSLLLIAFLTILCQHAAAAGPSPQPPAGFERFGVYVAGGTFDFTAPHPEVPGCLFARCDGRYFQEQLMGWGEVQILEEEIAAKAFFWQRFGIDVDAAESEGRVALTSVYADPRINYRVVHLSGYHVPPAGWEVHDGAYIVTISDPAGFELGGEFAGIQVPAGTFMVFGLYRILPTGRYAPGEPITVRFQSAAPILPLADGSAHFHCQMTHAEWGGGMGMGMAVATPLADGRTHFEARNVLTFPGTD